MIIAQISDTHIKCPDEESEQIDDTVEDFYRAVNHILNLPVRPDVVLVTGDCVNQGGIQQYQYFNEIIKQLHMPVYVVPGNHDNRENMKIQFGSQGDNAMHNFIQYVVNDYPVRLIALDTLIPKKAKGGLCQERLHWLKKRLEEETLRPTVIFQHHPPFKIGIPVLDRLGLYDSKKLGNLIKKHPNIERLLSGHVHCHVQSRFYGTIAATCPSTTQQTFIDLSCNERLSSIKTPPVILLHLWRKGMGIVSHVSIIGEFGNAEKIFDNGMWLKQS